MRDPSSTSRRSGGVQPNVANWKAKLGASVLYSLLCILDATLRWRRVDAPRGQSEVEGRAIFCIWHHGLALSLFLYQRHIRARPEDRCLAALVSASKDGAFLAEVLRRFDVQSVRGSTSRRGPQALLELTTWAEQGFDLAITPDGPRGPAGKVQEGVVVLAQLTGLPIIPVSTQLSRKIRLKSWDRFQIPIPFARCEVRFAEPLMVPREVSEDARAEYCLEVERRLNAITPD